MNTVLLKKSLQKKIFFLFFVVIILYSAIYRKFFFPELLSSVDGTQIVVTGIIAELNRLSVAITLFLTGIVFLTIKKFATRNHILFSFFAWSPFLIYLWISCLWSSDLSASLLRSANLTAQILAAILITCNRQIIREFYKAVVYFSISTCLLGLILFLFHSQWVFFYNGFQDAFTGLFVHKGLLSDVSAVGLILSVFFMGKVSSAQIRGNKKLSSFGIRLINLSICGISLLMSATLSSLCGVITATLSRGKIRLTLMIVGLLALFLPLLSSVFAPYVEIVGKNATFTGRTYLWELSLEQTQENLLFGHGFMHISNSDAWEYLMLTVFRAESFFIPHAHNLWVESLYKFGLLGTGTLFYCLIVLPYIRLKRIDNEVHLVSAILAVYFTFKGALTLPFLLTGFSSLIYTVAITHLMTAHRD